MNVTQETLDYCCEAGNITPQQLLHITNLYEGAKTDIEFMNELICDNWLNRDEAGNYIANQFSQAYISLSKTIFDSEIVQLIPKEIAIKLKAIPIYAFGDSITVAVADPINQNNLNILKNFIGNHVTFVFSFIDEIEHAIELQYTSNDELDKLLSDERLANEFAHLKDLNEKELLKVIESKKIVQISDDIIKLAIKQRASDIHIEPKKGYALVRFRVDGALQDRLTIPSQLIIPLLIRYKILAELDIAVKNLAQDGRIEYQLGNKEVDIRVSSLPTINGEKLVLRLLGSDIPVSHLEFGKLGFSPEIMTSVKEALLEPNGMLFVCGPTGSGKSTTLHCGINFLNKPNVNIITIEDPVEYEHKDITQVSINRKAGRDFSTILRSVLRQDPDIILLGEIRDLETAKIAANAALTGHMVLTTLHTNNAIQAVTRMVEMGVEHFVVAPSIIGVLAQRLVRKLCDHCKTAYTPSEEELAIYFNMEGIDSMPTLYQAQGCKACNDVGYYGRIAIHEFLRVGPELRDSILRGKEFDKIHSLAFKDKNYKPMIHDGFSKVLQGLTTFEEVIKVTSALFYNTDEYD